MSDRFEILLRTLSCLMITAGSVGAQSIPEDRPRARPASALTRIAEWEKGQEIFDRVPVPPAPPLSPEAAMKTFKLAPGYRLELVAAEPMVQAPISFEFDPEGRIWVVEYQGYMRDLQGTDEGAPICRIVVLEDEDGDGRMDKSTVFLDQLSMPRSLSLVKGGVLVQEPPTIWFCEDLDGDLRADRKTKVGTMGVAGNPQHTANGLRYGIDNWLHNADSPTRFRWDEGKLIEQETMHRGQFGVTFDDAGRFMSSYQNFALRMDLLPAEYLLRNPNLVRATGQKSRSSVIAANIAPGDAQVVYPIRPTPGITLGALELRDDGRLRTYTIVAGVWNYDGDQFPEDTWGNVFVPESGGHLVGRLKLTEGIRPEASRYYPPEQEFIASTDERFRPVNARTGPDGALYIADMYHGIIEHVIFMVPWLAEQVKERKLNEGNDMGRIYRIVAEDRPIDRTRPSLSTAPVAELVRQLSRPNRWWRLTAQRLLVERNDPVTPHLLKTLVRRGTSPLGRLHALWTLDGLGKLDAETKFSAMRDEDERVRAAAIRLAETGLNASQQSRLLTALERAADDPSERVRLQATLTASGLADAGNLALVQQLVGANDDALFEVAALTGLNGRELELVTRLLASAATDTVIESKWRPLLDLAVRCILAGRDSRQIVGLFTLLSAERAQEDGNDRVLFEAMVAGLPGGPKPAQPILLEHEPRSLTALARSDNAKTRNAAYRLLEWVTWPGNTALVAANVGGVKLTEAQQKQFTAGAEIYGTYCAACHQPHGGGAIGLAPPLAGSDWVMGSPERIARIILHGLYGPVTVNGETWNLTMPGLGASGLLDDEKIAAAMSYIRRAWENNAEPVSPDLVAAVRQETKGRTLPWTAADLAEVTGDAGSGEGTVVRPSATGEIELAGETAAVSGPGFEYRPSLDILGPWVDAQDIATWQVELVRPGTYQVFVLLAADAASAGDYFAIETEGSRTRGRVLSTGDYDTFREVPAGMLELRAGINRILMRSDGPMIRELADVRAIRLRPIP